MRINMNGTTITGSVSEVLATLTHLGIKASDTKPVTLPLVTEIAVTTPFEVVEAELAKLHTGETVTPEATPKLTRDGVIQQAIDDVKDLLSRDYYGGGSEADAVVSHVGDVVDFRLRNNPDRVDFFINADKRVVIAKLHLETTTSTGTAKAGVYATQGRAKCAPGDVFNEHIGKAIALRRALGLEVPVEYYEAGTRDSDDLAVGDVVQSNAFGYLTEITKMIDNPAPFSASGSAFHHTDDKDPKGWLASSQVTLINDSARHTAPDLEVSRIIRH